MMTKLIPYLIPSLFLISAISTNSFSHTLRPLSTDRPDQTESPYTVDSGHVQFELDFFNRTVNRSDSATDYDSKLGSINFKIGIGSHADLQFLVNPINYHHSESTGFGDVITRLKINLFGNDSGDIAFGVMPFIKWPLPQSEIRNGQWEGGIIVPFSMALPHPFDLGSMAELDWVAGSEYHHVSLFSTLVLGYALTDQVRIFGELATRFLVDSSPQVQWDMGATYSPDDNLQFDLGTNIGLTASSPKLVVFSGVSWRY